MQGIILKVTEAYCFILIPGDRQIFMHTATAWMNVEPPNLNDEVVFDVIPSKNPQHREQAANVRKIGAAISSGLKFLAENGVEVKS